MSPLINDVVFVGLSVCVGGGGLGLLCIIGWIGGHVERWNRRRVERNFTARLARGRDRYFEEKRSLEAALAGPAGFSSSDGMQRRDTAIAAAEKKPWSKPAMAADAALFGAMVLHDFPSLRFGVPAPAWSAFAGLAIVLLTATVELTRKARDRWEMGTLFKEETFYLALGFVAYQLIHVAQHWPK